MTAPPGQPLEGATSKTRLPALPLSLCAVFPPGEMAPPTLQVLGTKPKEPPPTPAFPSLLMHPRACESHGDSAPLASPAEALPSVTEPQQLPLLFLSRPRPPTLCPPPGHPRDSQVSSLSVHDWDLPVTQSDGQALHRQPPLTCLWMLVDVCDSGRDSPTVPLVRGHRRSARVPIHALGSGDRGRRANLGH